MKQYENIDEKTNKQITIRFSFSPLDSKRDFFVSIQSVDAFLNAGKKENYFFIL